MALFLDLDGVMADFDEGYSLKFGRCPREHNDVDWDALSKVDGFYLDLPPMPDYALLWNAVKRNKPTILSGIPKSIPEAAAHKRAWVDKYLGSEVPLITCWAKDKWRYCNPGDVIVDDYERYKASWELAGGIWVTHVSAESSLEQLRILGLVH